MKKKLLSLLLCALSIFSFGAFTGCTSDDDGEVKRGPGFTNEREKYFYGVQESMQECYTQDPMSDPEMTATLAGAMGFSSYRFRMEVPEVVTVNGQNIVSLVTNKVTEFHGYLDMLAENGITNYMAQSAYFLHPKNVTYPINGIVFPRPGTADYVTFMNIVEESYYLLAKEFKEIRSWQAGNEMNADYFCTPVSGAVYTLAEKAQIVTDLMYYANKGMKRGNPDSVSVMPGPAMNKQPTEFITQLYENIKSGGFPSTGDYVSTNTDEYFDALSWHPYNFSSGGDTSENSMFITQQLAVYDIAKQYGDDGKKVIFGEYGFSTTWKTGVTAEAMEETQKDLLAAAMRNIYEFLPFVETVHIFRLFDWDEAETKLGSGAVMEVGFGLFTSPGVSQTSLGPRPKKNCIELFKLINGENASLEPLYQYYKG